MIAWKPISALPDWSLAPTVRAWQALRGMALVAAATLVAELGDITRFANPRQLMAYLGLVPCEHSSGATRRQGGITKAGNGAARRMLIEAAWSYRFPARISRVQLLRQEVSAERAHALLKGCRGHLHADAYAGFAGLYEADPLTGAPAPLTEVACWAHARRKIYDIHVETKSPAAAHALEMIARLFAIEAGIKGRPPAERLAARRAKVTPILSELRAFLDATMEKISGKSSLAGAFRYAASRWTALTRYVDNGRLEMSNNAAERAMRPLALGRKYYLFAGSDEGGRRAAIIYTLIETARLNDVDPEAWLGDVISRIADHPNTKIDELLPWKWTRAASQAIAA